MKPEINKLNYSSYRIPFIEEFIDGFEYEYVNWKSTQNTKIPIVGLCKCLVGTTILQARILNVNNLNKTVHVKFLEKGHGVSYNKVMGYAYDPIKNEDTEFPQRLLYNYKGFEKPYVFYKNTQKHWKKGIWNTPIISKGIKPNPNYGIDKKTKSIRKSIPLNLYRIEGYTKKEKEKVVEELKKGNIIAKGQVISQNKTFAIVQQPYWLDPKTWIFHLPKKKLIMLKQSTTYTPKESNYRYRIEYKSNNNIIKAKYVDSIPEILSFAKKNTKIIRCIENKQEVSLGEEIYKQIAHNKIREVMSTKQMRDQLLNSYVLCFMFQGLNVEIYPPITNSNKTYDFSKSIFINGKQLNLLDIKSKEYTDWYKSEPNSQFKKHLYELISPNINNNFSEDNEKELAKYLYNIRATQDNETHFYTVSYVIDKEPTKIQIEVLREWTEDRAKTAIIQKVGCYPSNILNIEQHGCT